jgi:hypothetical protein
MWQQQYFGVTGHVTVWSILLVSNIPQPLGEMMAEIIPSVESITIETQAAVLENCKIYFCK